MTTLLDRLFFKRVAPFIFNNNISGEIIGGLTSCLVAIAYGITFSSLIFSGHLRPWIGYGVESTFITMAVISAVMAARSSIPFVIAGPDGATSAVTATLLAAFLTKLDEVGEPDDLLAPTMILLALSTALTGVICWLIGIYRAANAIRFIPYPVIGGFLSATGLFLIDGGIKTVTNKSFTTLVTTSAIDASTSLKIASTCLLYLVMLIIQRLWKSPYAIPMVILSSIFVGNAILLISGISLEHAQSTGWFLHPPRDVNLIATWNLSDLANFPWNALPTLSGDIVAMVFVTTVTTLLNTNGIELIAKKDANLNREMETIGVANIVSSICGGYIGCTSINRTNLNFSTGARGRLSGFVLAIISFAILFNGTRFTNFIPNFVLGGLLLNLGVGLLYKWAVETKRILSLSEYCILIAVMLVILKWGFIAGVAIGVIIGCGTFAYGASKAKVIKFFFDASEYSSSLDRSSEEIQMLNYHKRQIQGFVLQSYLFFGSANSLYEFIKNIININQECRYLIFDFKLVNGIDSSAVHSFRQIKDLTQDRSITVVFSGIDEGQESALNSIISAEDLVIDDIDKALEFCENQVINRYILIDTNHEFISWLARDLNGRDIAERLSSLCERQEILKDEVVSRQGAQSDCMHFILSGRLGVLVQFDDKSFTRVRSLGRHTTVGEMGLLTGELRSATLKAEEDCVIYRLSKSEFEKIKISDPELCEALLTYIVSILSQRLRSSNATIAALQR